MLRTIVFISTLTFFLSNSLLADNLKKRKQVIADQLYEIMVEGGDLLGYSKEILRHLSKVDKIVPGKIKKDPRDYRNRRYRRSRRDDTIDAFSLLSGGLAIRESLQLESIGRSADDVREIDISTLQGPLVKSHPFKDMLRGRKYNFFSLAKYCPEDFYYFRFNNMEKSLELFGFKPVCPMGGRYSFDRKTGKVSNSIFGSSEKPVILYEKIKSDMIKTYFGTEEIKVELEFTKEGIKTRILTR